jgi:predicted RNase H-like HicB family nuclease
MKKYLAVVDRCDGGGFRGYLPRVPGCEVHAATAEEAEAKIIEAGRARITAENGVKPEEVEIVAAVEAPPPPRPRPDGMDAIYDQARRDFDPKCLEVLLNWENEVWYPFEDILRDLEGDPKPLGKDELQG